MRHSLRTSIVVTSLLAVALLAGCAKKTPATTEPTESPSASVSPSASPTVTPTIVPEAQRAANALTEQEIKTMQASLNAVGCFAGAIDGSVGPNTQAGLEAFQKASGLTVDGDYGPKTAAKLQADASAKKTVCGTKPTATPNSSGPPCTLQAVQAAVPGFKIGGYACSGKWAYAEPEGTSQKGKLLTANGSAWKQVPCPAPVPDPKTGQPGPPPGSGIPPNIFNGACIAV